MTVSLAPARMKNASHYATNYAIALPHGVEFDDVLKPEFWAHVSTTLRQHDTLRIIPEDGSYFAELLVLSAGRGFAKVKVLREIKLTEDEVQDADAPDGIVVKWRGPHSKWCIERASDNHRLREGLVEKGDAYREAANYKDAA